MQPDERILLATGIYATFNVLMMMLYAQSLLGPTPFGLIMFFLAVSAIGAAAMLPVYCLYREVGVSLSATFVATVTFAALIWFNLWCLWSASAAV